MPTPTRRALAFGAAGATLLAAMPTRDAEAADRADRRGGGPGGPGGARFVAAWAASVQGPYPVGNPTAQPDLRFAFPDANAGARDQTFRLIVKPDIFGRQARIRLSNAFGAKAITFDDVYVGLQNSGAAVVAGTSQKVAFAGQNSVTVEPGKWVTSDPIPLAFVRHPADPLLVGRKLAVSFHVAGETGPMTWHAKALTTSFVTRPGAGSASADEGEQKFPFSTASWYFLDAVEMTAAPGTRVVVGFGDSITDGTASTINGDDRWPDVLSRRLKAARIPAVVVNAGIGGNQVIGPPTYPPPFAGGPSALSRLDRDVASLPGVTHVIWLEGINDFSRNGNATAEAVIAGYRQGVAALRAKIPGVKVIGATLPSALGSTSAAHGFPEQDEKRKALNEFIRKGGVFDGVADFDSVTLDAATGGMKPEFVPESSTGGPGDKLHPNRAGYAAMGGVIDLALLGGVGAQQPPRQRHRRGP